MRLLLILTLLPIIVGCATVPPQTKAISNALTTDAALREATELCSTLGSTERRLAQKERVDWWKRNGNYVVAADYGLLELNWSDANTVNEGQRAVLAMQVLENVQLDAQATVSGWLGEFENTDDCIKLFKQVNKGKLDITKDKSDVEVLDALAAKRQDVSNDAELARTINARYRKYGRSMYIAEKELKAQGCSKPQIALLRNSWPLEVYDAVCDQQDYVVVTCDWGRCEVKR